MAYSRVTKIGDGVSTQFVVNFANGYIDPDHVTARVGNEVDGLGQPVYRTITFLSSNLMQISGAPAGIGVKVLFERTVPKDSLIINYSNGDVLDEENLDTSQRQMLQAVQEVVDGRFATLTQDLDFGGFKGINVGTPTANADVANKEYVDARTGNIAEIVEEIAALAPIADDIVAVAAIKDDVPIVAALESSVSLLAVNAALLDGTASALYAREDLFTGNGTAVEFTLTKVPPSAANVDVFVGGAIQTLSDYTVVGNKLTFTVAPETGLQIVARTKVQLSANQVEDLIDNINDLVFPTYAEAVGGTEATKPMNSLRTNDVIRHHLGNWVSVNQFGAAATGLVDDTAAFQAAINALPAGGGDVYGTGPFLIRGPVNINKPNVRFVISGRIYTDVTTGDLFNVTQSGFKWANPHIESLVTRTSGRFIYIHNASFCYITDFVFRKHYIGLDIDGSSIVRINGGDARNATHRGIVDGGGHIKVGATNLCVAVEINDVVADSDLATVPPATSDMCAFGLWFGYVDAPLVSGCDIIRSGRDIVIAPGAGQVAANGFVHHSWFDTAEYGLFVVPTGGGAVARWRFDTVWTGGHTQSGRFLFGSTGIVMGMRFHNCMANICQFEGTVISGNVTDTFIDYDSSAGCGGSGFTCGVGVSKFYITNSRYGQHDDFGPNGRPIYIPSGCADYQITDNDFRYNTAGVYDESKAGYVARNRGYVTSWRGYAEFGPTSTSKVVTHGLQITPDITDISAVAAGPLGTASLWIDPASITSTTFTVRLSGGPLGYTCGFIWQVFDKQAS